MIFSVSRETAMTWPMRHLGGKTAVEKRQVLCNADIRSKSGK